MTNNNEQETTTMDNETEELEMIASAAMRLAQLVANGGKCEAADIAWIARRVGAVAAGWHQ